MSQNYIDWHCHLLPGIDDGPAELPESLEMAEILMKSGFSEVYCTPHCMRGGYDASSAMVREAVKELQRRLDAEGISLTLHPGREYYLDEFFMEHLADPLLLGGSRNLLIEIPGFMDPEYVRQTFYRIRMKGYIPVIAHPERCPLLSPPKSVQEYRGPSSEFKAQNHLLRKLADLCRSVLTVQRATNQDPDFSDSEPGTRNPELVGYLREIGAKFQGNLGSFAGIYDEKTRHRAHRFHKAGIYTHFGSDAHNPVTLATWLPEGLASVAPQTHAAVPSPRPAIACAPA